LGQQRGGTSHGQTIARRHAAHDASTAGNTCALSNGKVACIGDDKQLQLGGTEPGTPIPLERDAVAISAGYAHTCALLDDGRLACWGSNQYGQLGPNADPGPPSLPVLVDLGVPIVKVACGREHTCAKTELDRVYCWGRNDFGQLGNGELGDTTAHAAPDARVTRSLCSPL
jgi:alpha-tubulin suppressor-like RCC1 family protein